MKPRIIVMLAALILLTCGAQDVFGQKKQKSKQKSFEAVVRENLKDYEGTYLGIDSTCWIEIRLGADGKLSATSFEDGRRTELENIKLEGARLIATKLDPDGRPRKFDGVFGNRILNGESRFGIMVAGLEIKVPGVVFDKIFYTRR